MKLIDLMTVFDENKELVVTDAGIVVARYDGKDSIPTELNDRDVFFVSPRNNKLYVEIL